MPRQIEIPREQLAAFCRRHHIRKLSLFGSVLREDFAADSDVDVLVEFQAGYTPGFALIRMEDELSMLFGDRKVDLITPKFLNRRIRDRMLSESEVQYAEG